MPRRTARGLVSDKTVEAMCSASTGRNRRSDSRSCLRVQKSRLADGVDQCPLGLWELVSGSQEFEADLQRRGPVGQHGARISVGTRAKRYLEIRKDGTLAHNASDTSLIIAKGNGVMTRRQRVGPGVGYWDAREGKLELCVISDREPQETKVVANGRTVPVPPLPTNRSAHVMSGTSTYTCSATELRVEKQVFGYRANWLYRRVRGGCE